jgi:hypothetical protein
MRWRRPDPGCPRMCRVRGEAGKRCLVTSPPAERAPESESDRQEAVRHAAVALRSIGQPNSVAGEFDFWDNRFEGRRLFSELLGTFFLVLVAVGGGMVSARFGGSAVPYGAKVVAPALMVAAVILFMGTVSGAYLAGPVAGGALAVGIAYLLRGWGGGRSGVAAAEGTLGADWHPGPRPRP